MWINRLLLVIGGLLGLLCTVALTLFPMRPEDVQSQAALWLSDAGFPSWGKGLATTTDDWINDGLWALLIVCIILLFVAVVRMFRSSKGGTANTTEPPELPTQGAAVPELEEPGGADFSDFDVPIRDAIEHVVETSVHTFNNSGDAEQQAFEALHKEMCADKLPVIGMLGDFNAPERISARKCSELRPRPVVVPRNLTSPNGVLFALIDETKIAVTPLVERSDPLGFTGLRVCSADLYRKWPKDQE